MFRFLALLLAIMITAMSVPAPAMMAAMAPQDVSMADCGAMPDGHGDKGLPMSAECQKCCLATLALPLAMKQPAFIPFVPMHVSAAPMEAHPTTPEPPPPRSA